VPLKWEFTGSLHTPRYYHTATLLSDGTVLVIGGATNGPEIFPDPGTPSVEVYDPATGTWTVNGSLIGQRLLHTATLLPDGNLVVAGGWPDPYSTYTWELYDPATQTWTFTGSLHTGRQNHMTTLLANGTVLVAGGMNSGTVTSAEI
jgi:N-acetylneuraminic acid mutarotase